MIYGYSQDYEPVKEIEVNHLVCPLSGEQEPMKLILYKLTTEDNLVKRVHKKATGVFYKVKDQEPIPVVQWTNEMEDFFLSKREDTPYESKTTLSIGGKISIGVILALVGIITYKATLGKSGREDAKAEYLAFPNPGDRYFGNLNDFRQGSKSAWTWAKIESVNPTDSTVMVRISTDVPLDYKKANEVNSEDFSQEIIPMKFTIEYDSQKNPNKIQLLGKDVNFNPTSPASGEDIDEVKKTAK